MSVFMKLVRTPGGETACRVYDLGELTMDMPVRQLELRESIESMSIRLSRLDSPGVQALIEAADALVKRIEQGVRLVELDDSEDIYRLAAAYRAKRGPLA